MPSKLIIAASIGVIIVLAACGSPSLAGGTPAGEACSLLTQVQVSAALRITVGPGRRFLPSLPQVCLWSEPVPPHIQRVQLTISNPVTFASERTPIPGVTKTPVSGIGDDAYYVTVPVSGTSLHVKKGSFAFSLGVGGPGISVDQIKAMEKTLAQDVLAKL
ncbi:MAG TPA: hypothetical protein VJT32_08860, partial [bacterium]|nr:hypothetical protein [bacterium]